MSTSFSLETVTPTLGGSVITVTQVVYGLPSLLMMILFFIFFGFSKNYKHSFYRLVQVDLLVNILCYLNTWLSLRLDKHPIGVQIRKDIETLVPGSLTFSTLLIAFFMHMQFWSAAALSIHRITSVVFHQSYEKAWSRYYPIFVLLAALYSTIPPIAGPGTFLDINIVNGTLTGTYNSVAAKRTVVLAALFSCIYFVSLLTIGLLAAFLVSRKVRESSSDDLGISRKLTKIALTYCSIYTGILLWSIVNAINGIFPFLADAIQENSWQILLFSSDMMTLALPYILLLYDSNIRSDVIKLVTRRTAVGPTRAFVSSSSNN